jgi:hypothetical protein
MTTTFVVTGGGFSLKPGTRSGDPPANHGVGGIGDVVQVTGVKWSPYKGAYEGMRVTVLGGPLLSLAVRPPRPARSAPVHQGRFDNRQRRLEIHLRP